jgi:hypothetical protein
MELVAKSCVVSCAHFSLTMRLLWKRHQGCQVFRNANYQSGVIRGDGAMPAKFARNDFNVR